VRLSEEEMARLLTKPGYRVIDTQAPRSLVEPSALQEVSGAVLGADAMPEGLLLGRIRRLALDHGWRAFHVYDSRRSEYGYPDLTLARPGSPLYLWELKAAKGKLTHDQEVWLSILQQVTGVEAACYRPSDWPMIVEKLRRKGPRP